MPRQSPSSTDASGDSVRLQLPPAAIVVLVFTLFLSATLPGCTGDSDRAGYTVDSFGKLAVSCPAVTVSEEVIEMNQTYARSRLTLHTQEGDVIAWLAAPREPLAGTVYAPGAGETIAAHDARMIRYAAAGFAFLYLDIRGNGGETAGLPFGQQLVQSDYAKFTRGAWPQYYLTVCDLSSARRYLADRYGCPVYAMGSSNGGRYAAVAAGVDPAFAGYVGISTSDWGIRDSFGRQGIRGDPIRFAASLEPSTYIASISPRPVWVFHAKTDPIIPSGDGETFFNHAKEPRTFSEFAGSHGINSDADEKILSAWGQIYGTRG